MHIIWCENTQIKFLNNGTFLPRPESHLENKVLQIITSHLLRSEVAKTFDQTVHEKSWKTVMPR